MFWLNKTLTVLDVSILVNADSDSITSTVNLTEDVDNQTERLEAPPNVDLDTNASPADLIKNIDKQDEKIEVPPNVDPDTNASPADLIENVNKQAEKLEESLKLAALELPPKKIRQKIKRDYSS